MLKQKARLKWTIEGDENTKFFHAMIRRKNSKCNFRGHNINGSWCEDPIVVKDAIFEHFKGIFSKKVHSRPSLLPKNSSGPDCVNRPGPGSVHMGAFGFSSQASGSGLSVIAGRPSAHISSNTTGTTATEIFKLSTSQAMGLEEQFSGEEIWETVNGCANNKAPGPDGFNMRFFKKIWAIISDDLIEAIRGFWQNGTISPGCNSSFITLIPKVANPVNLNEYRPISLIGSFYKIIAKLLSNRIKKVIPNLVGFEQSAFIKGRNIMDGVLFANESLEFLRSKHIKSMVFKVDFEKAFDSLNWDFLDEMMLLMGFGSKWRKWITSCIGSASVSVLVNGSPTKEFNLGRGVMQGDPLSPFLFIIAAEGLNWMAKSAVSNGRFFGVEIGKDKIPLSHLQYADDTIFFGKWSFENLENLMKLLKCFELCSGLKVNYNKSKLFGVGVDKEEVRDMSNLFGCNIGTFPMTYLGLPIGANVKKLSNWKPVIDKFVKRLLDWKARTISFGGRLTLVYAVLNSLPLYYFSLYRAPPFVLKKLESVRRNFFWGGSGDVSKISWVKWDDVIRSRADGELSVGSLNCKNLALIGKWWWRFLTEPTSLWVKVIKRIEIDNAGVEFSRSFERKIGNGHNTKLWEDVWLLDKPLKEVFKRLVRLESNPQVLVANRIHSFGGSVVFSWSWSRSITGRTKDELDRLKAILSSVTLNPEKEDYFSWKLSNFGSFSTKRLTKHIMEKVYPSSTTCVASMKNNLVPKKVEIFVWRAKRERLPMLSELDKRGIDLHSVLCPLCDSNIETVGYSLLSCSHAWVVWEKVRDWWGFDSANLSFDDLFRGLVPSSCSDWGHLLWQAKDENVYICRSNKCNSICRFMVFVEGIMKEKMKTRWCVNGGDGVVHGGCDMVVLLVEHKQKTRSGCRWYSKVMVKSGGYDIRYW
ncbi:uncharacterized protein [Rutidosis leptorrhynchoides]|uniref:uncharacterized protein n=1 Tax=Rutidosis leptorrhynchoides TaxID=125765 RepID=UPI003A98F678